MYNNSIFMRTLIISCDKHKINVSCCIVSCDFYAQSINIQKNWSQLFCSTLESHFTLLNSWGQCWRRNVAILRLPMLAVSKETACSMIFMIAFAFNMSLIQDFLALTNFFLVGKFVSDVHETLVLSLVVTGIRLWWYVYD